MRIIAAAVSLFSLASAAWAQDWAPLDARSRSLGGAGVAFADGRADSLYWNPATLAVGSEKVLDFTTGFSFSLSVYADGHVAGGVVSDITHVIDLYDASGFEGIQNNFNSATPTFTDTDVQTATSIIDSILKIGGKGEGLLTGAGAGFNLRVGPFGLFVHGLGDIGGAPIIDFSGTGFTTNPAAFFGHIQTNFPAGALTPAGANLSAAMQGAGLSATDANNVAFQAQSALGDAAISDPAFVNAMTQLARGTATGATTSLYDNPSGVLVRALAQVEAGISFALPVIPTVLDLGVSFKEIISQTSYSLVRFAEKDSEDNLNDRIKDDLRKDHAKRSTTFNMDLGVQAQPLDRLALGLSARNLIPMTLEFEGPGGTMHLDPQVRLGAMIHPLGFLKIGADVDLVENESPVLPGYHTRHFGAGVELDFPVFKFRVGYDDNLAFTQDHGRLTAGIGLDFFGFLLIDVGAQASLTEIEYKAAKVDGSEGAKTFPSDRVSAGITIGANFPF